MGEFRDDLKKTAAKRDTIPDDVRDMSGVPKVELDALLPCTWLTDDDGGRCGGEAVVISCDIDNSVKVSCVDQHCETMGLYDTEPEAHAEWNRNQRALMSFQDVRDAVILMLRAEKERDELKQEVANHLAVATAFGAANRKVRAEFDSIRTALGPLASDDLVGDVARVVGWMAAIIGLVNAFEYGEIADKCVFADKVKRHCDAIAEYRTAMKGKADEVI